jgi:molybdopterin/thiamine biosynthesis adenylyltransferase
MSDVPNNIFNYDLAFSRNLGWLTNEEQKTLSTKKVAIAGMGGVGGHYAEVLARLGVSCFHISDFDEFEVQNFNRQNCSGMQNLKRKKVEVIREKILDINPMAEVIMFSSGVNDLNVEKFLSNVDLYLDGLDFFVLDVRQIVFDYCHQKQIPALTIAPVGMGASLIVFDKMSMSFKEHFGLSREDSPEDAAIKFLVGLTPTLKQVRYLADKSKSDFKNKKAPSLPMGPYLCAGIAGTEAIKILLNRKKTNSSPWVIHFDAYLQSYHKNYLWWGHKNIFQRIKFIMVKNILRKNQK